MRYTVRPISDRTPFTGNRRRSPFSANWAATERLLLTEVRALHGRGLVLECDVSESQIRLDGTLYARATPATPAIRVAFESEHGPLTYATDRFLAWQDNVRAIALSLEALRKVDRYGVTGRGEQYAGFKQIGAGTGAAPSGASARMDEDAAWSIIGSFGESSIAEQRRAGDGGRAAFRRARAFAHPDRHDGSQRLWDQVEQAGRVLGLVR